MWTDSSDIARSIRRIKCFLKYRQLYEMCYRTDYNTFYFFYLISDSNQVQFMEKMEECTITLKPDAAYNFIHTVLFGCLAFSTMRYIFKNSTKGFFRQSTLCWWECQIYWPQTDRIMNLLSLLAAFLLVDGGIAKKNVWKSGNRDVLKSKVWS